MYRDGINRILSNLPARVRTELVGIGARREMRRGETLLRTGQPISSLIFPFSGIATVLYGNGEGSVAVEIIGNEGFVGRPVLLGVPAASTCI